MLNLILNREELIIAGNNLIDHKYNELNSKTYNYISYKIGSYSAVYTEGILSTEKFNI